MGGHYCHWKTLDDTLWGRRFCEVRRVRSARSFLRKGRSEKRVGCRRTGHHCNICPYLWSILCGGSFVSTYETKCMNVLNVSLCARTTLQMFCCERSRDELFSTFKRRTPVAEAVFCAAVTVIRYFYTYCVASIEHTYLQWTHLVRRRQTSLSSWYFCVGVLPYKKIHLSSKKISRKGSLRGEML